ncbi:MAG: rRNA maturation RNase YbeY [Pirellulales bacterium]|nr:rRNA maturation RNase YbeY [Pirellulales bacterium]
MTQKNSPRRRSACRLPPAAFEGYSIAVANRQRRWRIDSSALKSAVAIVFRGENIASADVSIAVVSDAAIHDMNRQFLNHDEPTDVISFALDQDGDSIDGEIVISADTAAATAAKIGWTAQEEMLLYVIHGALHLTGYDDLKPAARRQMRSREKRYLTQLGIESPPAKSTLGGEPRP